tara:strand:- start:1322 stop:2725 length:1404 start_codon:yes stop_codon:yes gene_type:complete
MITETTLKRGSEIIISIESLAFGGKGLARYNNIVIFVKNGIPGQKLKVVIIKKSKQYLEAKILEIISESKYYIEPVCQHFKYCGGCSFQNLDYEMQIQQKTKQIKDIFERIGSQKDYITYPLQKCNNIYEYRNKMEFTFSNRRWILKNEPPNVESNFALGLHIPGRYDKILDINQCHIQNNIANKILNIVKEHSQHMEPYDIIKHKGFLRNLMIRHAFNTNQTMVNIVTAFEDIDILKPMVTKLVQDVNSIASIVNNITTRKAGVSIGEYEVNLYGEKYIQETINGLTFNISANSFFQTNTNQTEKLYSMIIEESNLKKTDIVYDLYCGTGTIGISMAKYVKFVYGFEIVGSAVDDANINAKLNNINNIIFFKGDLQNIFRVNLDIEKIEKPSIVVIDPPRAGMHKKTISDIIAKEPKKIIYISCNPSTQARDIKELSIYNYKLKKILPLDMFPHTPHLENIAVIEK